MNHLDLEKLADQTLLKLRTHRIKPIAVASLAKSFKTTGDNIELALRLIAAWGYRIRRSRKGEVTMSAVPDRLTAAEVQYHLKTKFIARKVYAFLSVKSTNDIAGQLAEAGEAEGTVVTAEEQTRGRGRMGRHWHSPVKTGIYLSIILKPKFGPESAPGLSIMTALALADTLAEYCPDDVRIKWPNDILISNKKAAGILTELAADKDRIHHVIIGVGINVNQKVEDFPDELRNIATSIRRVIKKKADRTELVKTFLAKFERYYLVYQKHRLTPSHPKILRYSCLIGQQVKLSSGRKIICGTAVDINKTGALVIEVDGRRQVISSGEVSVVKDA